MKRLFILGIAAFIFSACNLIQEKNTLTDTILKNPLQHNVEIYYYLNGIITDSVVIPMLSQKIVSSINNRGKGSGLTYPNIVISFFDSAAVAFDDTVWITHYPKNANPANSTALIYINPRNLFNQDNYTRTVMKEDKNYIENLYIFEFVEQDYIYARDK